MLEILQSRAERGEDVCEETVAVLQAWAWPEFHVCI